MFCKSTLLMAALCAAFFIGACKSDTHKSPAASAAAPANETAAAAKPEVVLFAVMVDKLNLRDQPSKTSNVIAQFPEGSFVKGTDEVSANKEEATLRGIIYTEPYTKVVGTGTDTQSGWAYLGALQKIYAGSAASTPDLNALASLSNFLKGLNVKQMDSGKKAWDYVKKQFSGVNGTTADAVFVLLERFLRRMEVEGEYYKPMEAIEWTPEDNEAIYKHQFKYAKYPATRALPENGFRLEAAEGSVFPVTDPMQLHAFFASKVTPAMKAFLDQDCLIEQNEQAVSDGGFIIPLEQILDRCVFWEKFNTSHPNFILSDQTNQSELWMRTTFITGMNNTPVFDYETEAVTADYLKVWAYAQQKYPDTKVGALIKEFSTLVVSEGNKRTPKVDDYINKVVLLE